MFQRAQRRSLESVFFLVVVMSVNDAVQNGLMECSCDFLLKRLGQKNLELVSKG